jgi:hypothetical protein
MSNRKGNGTPATPESEPLAAGPQKVNKVQGIWPPELKTLLWENRNTERKAASPRCLLAKLLFSEPLEKKEVAGAGFEPAAFRL